jgi:hypothetical protein
MVAVRMARSEPPQPQGADRPSELALMVVEMDTGPLTAVLGSGGSAAPAAVVLPGPTAMTIPGQGEATVAEAALLPGRQAATAVANLLGVWIPHHVRFGQRELGTAIDRSGGVELRGTTLSGSEAVASLNASGKERDESWRATLEAVLGAVTWEAVDLPGADQPSTVADLLNAAHGAGVEVLPGDEVGGGIVRVDPGRVRTLVTSVFGVPDREVLPVIVLNGSGEPGVGERVAEYLIPGGFRVVVSANASTFDHETTTIVVASEERRPLGERVRDWLGVGEVQVAGSASGLAEVTIMVGKDFSA